MGLLLIMCSCSKSRNVDQEIKDRIAAFYKSADVKDYSPISYGSMDTIQNLKDINGNIMKLTGKLEHTFTAKSQMGIQEQYTDTFDITVFKDAVIALPRGYDK